MPQIPPAEAAAATAAGEWLLDVREQHEWDEVHTPTGHLIPMGQIADRTDELPDTGRILVLCRSGARSAVVTRALLDAGYPAVNVEGGILAWEASGAEVVRSAPSGPAA